MSKVILVNPANIPIGYSLITPRWLPVLAQATPSDLVGKPILVDESIAKFKPEMVRPGDIVGIGITTGNCIPGYKVLAEAKKRGASVIVGGIHATIFPEEPLEMGADAVLTGGGDIMWAPAIRDALDGKLKKIYRGGQVPGELLLQADWSAIDTSKYMFPSVQTVAGCPENCSFCSVWVTDGRHPRQRLTAKIIAEVNQLYDLGYRFIIFADDNFNPATIGRIAREPSPGKKKQLEKIREERLEFFREYRRAVPHDMYAFTQMTTEIVSDPEYLQAMREMGVRAALVGVESFSQKGLENANKTWNPVGEKMADVIRKIQEKGILVLSSIICGLESDTVESIATMREFAKRSGTILAQFTLYSPYPGTVDFLEMMQDYKNRTHPEKTAFPAAPKHQVQILYDNFWRDDNKPGVLIKHPHMAPKTLVYEINKSWNDFYSLSALFSRARMQKWPWTAKIWYMLGSLAFKSLYAGHGLSADSVKSKKIPFAASLLMKSAVTFYNKFFRAKKRAGLMSEI